MNCLAEFVWELYNLERELREESNKRQKDLYFLLRYVELQERISEVHSSQEDDLALTKDKVTENEALNDDMNSRELELRPRQSSPPRQSSNQKIRGKASDFRQKVTHKNWVFSNFWSIFGQILAIFIWFFLKKHKMIFVSMVKAC